jgi:pilus assembly protein CpaC
VHGQTFAIAGLLNSTMNTTMRKVPGIGEIPILGRLFQSKAAQRERTELVVLITPEILDVDSPGVTGELPKLLSPFMPGIPADKQLDPPPPAFIPAPAR